MRAIKKSLVVIMMWAVLGVIFPSEPTGKTGAAATETETTTERKTTTTTTTTNKDTTLSKKEKEKKKALIKKKKKKAKKYIGKKLTSLVKAIGKYKRLIRARSCYYRNEYDGIAKYDGFSVYCHTKKKKKWYVDAVE